MIYIVTIQHEDADQLRKWDGKTLSALYMICIVHRRDIKSLRDLDGTHVEYLRHLKKECCRTVTQAFKVESDQLRLYIHCMSFSSPQSLHEIAEIH